VIPLHLNTLVIGTPLSKAFDPDVIRLGFGPLPPVPPNACDAGERLRRRAVLQDDVDARYGKYTEVGQLAMMGQYDARCQCLYRVECLRTDDPAFECRDVTLAELVLDAAGVVAKAARLGPLTLLDANGEPRLRLSVLTDEDDDD
jgi:hypothetical protein